MAKHWKPYEQALSEVEAWLAEMLPDDTRRLANLEDLANRQLQNWLADGLIDATAWQLQWKRGQGAFGGGSLGLHCPEGETDEAVSDRLAYNGQPISIPSYWWEMWLSSDDASRDLFHYPHYRGSRRRLDGQGSEWIGPRFIATGAKLFTSGIGECWRVIHVEAVRLRKLISGMQPPANVGAEAAPLQRGRGRPAKAPWDDIKSRVFAHCRFRGLIGEGAPSPDELRLMIERDPDFPTNEKRPSLDTIRTEYAQPWANELRHLGAVG
jgi:hypothetical protein